MFLPYTRLRVKGENISAVKAAPSAPAFVKIVEKSTGGVDIHTLTVRRVFFCAVRREGLPRVVWCAPLPPVFSFRDNDKLRPRKF